MFVFVTLPIAFFVLPPAALHVRGRCAAARIGADSSDRMDSAPIFDSLVELRSMLCCALRAATRGTRT